MTRVVYIFEVDDNANNCADKIKRTSEEAILPKVVDPKELRTFDYLTAKDNRVVRFLTPFLNQYQGWCACVNSNYVSTIDIDRFFSYAILKNEAPVVYFIRYDVWVFNCDDPVLKELNPHVVNSKTYQEIIDSTNIATVYDI